MFGAHVIVHTFLFTIHSLTVAHICSAVPILAWTVTIVVFLF